jgi:two-component system, response regulator
VGKGEKIILLIEDTEDDAALFARAFKRSGCEGVLHHVSTVEQAIDFITVGAHPKLVFLDLLLPNLRGIHLLRWIRGHESCKCIPVVVLAGVVSESTLRDLCALGANAVMIKPATSTALQEAVGAACIFWLNHCVPPRGTESG